MIDSEHGTITFRRESKDPDEDRRRVEVTGPLPPYILRQMEVRKPKALPENHPANNPNAKTIRRPMIETNGEWR